MTDKMKAAIRALRDAAADAGEPLRHLSDERIWERVLMDEYGARDEFGWYRDGDSMVRRAVGERRNA